MPVIPAIRGAGFFAGGKRRMSAACQSDCGRIRDAPLHRQGGQGCGGVARPDAEQGRVGERCAHLPDALSAAVPKSGRLAARQASHRPQQVQLPRLRRKKAGYEQIAALFLQTAKNEKAHAKLGFKALDDTAENLLHAAKGEKSRGSDTMKLMNDSSEASVKHPFMGLSIFLCDKK